MKKNIIYLTGFMGAGKSTVGPILANTLGWDYYDLDKVIELKTGKKIRQIFEESGENYFRELETAQLKEISAGDNLVIALGGGTISSANNLSILQRYGEIIYLKTSLESVYKRLRFKDDRPLLKVNEAIENPEEEVMKRLTLLYESRKAFYEKADFIVETESVPIGSTVDYIAKIIQHKNKGRGIEKTDS
jgi:shikimate kinase